MELFTQKAALHVIARLAPGDEPLTLSVNETIAFGEDWLDLGSMTVHPEPPPQAPFGSFDIAAALRFGAYEWRLPPQQVAEANLQNALGGAKKADDAKKWLHEGLQDAVRRLTLLWPTFDADSVARLPFRRPTTIVPDTTAITQGGLDFVGRFLGPWARIKVPAVAHMEVDNHVDNYFRVRRDRKHRGERNARALRHHLISQGAQRTLLRLQFDRSVEIDRGDLGADPLRGIISQTSDTEDKNLGLQEVTRSFADRLIVETARRFQTQVRTDHPLFILTSDQGMARMAMAEGLGVMFFEARSSPSVYGKVLTGCVGHPFVERRLHHVSATELLWELAVSFGAARLASSRGCFEVHAMPESGLGAVWQPMHAREDALWGLFRESTKEKSAAGLPQGSPVDVAVPEEKRTSGASGQELLAKDGAQKRAGGRDGRQMGASSARKSALPSYGFTPNKMFKLIWFICEHRKITRDEGQRTLEVTWQDEYLRYERFLSSGGLIIVEGDEVSAAPSLQRLKSALAGGDLGSALGELRAVPSYDALLRDLGARRAVQRDDPSLPVAQKALVTYLMISEALGAVVEVRDVGIVCTDAAVDPPAFAALARTVYEKLALETGSEWVLTGKWLEDLATAHAVHPVVARRLLGEAREAGHIEVYFEGSTPDQRFDAHALWILVSGVDVPQLVKRPLYHGDFLVPGTAAVRLKVKEKTDAA